MGWGIVLIFIIVALWAMSGPFAIMVLGAVGSSLAYAWSISEQVNGRGSMTGAQLQILFMLLPANIGLMALGITCGVLRRFSDSPEAYIARRNRLYKFLVKWGAIYAVYYLTVKTIAIRFGIDDGLVWFALRSYGVYGFAVLLAIYYLLKPKRAKRIVEPVRP